MFYLKKSVPMALFPVLLILWQVHFLYPLGGFTVYLPLIHGNPPRQGRIVFASINPTVVEPESEPQSSETWDIYSMNADGSNRTNLTQTPGVIERWPLWSPDGTRIAFVSDADGYDSLYVTDDDGINRHQLSRDRTVITDPFRAPFDWSPDGTKIVFWAWEEGKLKLWVANRDGSDITLLVQDMEGVWPAWSPDGTRIAFAAIIDGFPLAVYSVATDGTDPVNHTADLATAWFTYPIWSPDNTRLAFIYREGIGLIHVESADFVQVSSDTDAAFLAWSPDGRQLAFASKRGNNQSDIFLIGVDGTNERNLTQSDADDDQVAWSPDGTQLVFTSYNRTEETTDVYVINADGTGLLNLTQSKATEAAPDWR